MNYECIAQVRLKCAVDADVELHGAEGVTTTTDTGLNTWNIKPTTNDPEGGASPTLRRTTMTGTM